jgi:hypothetical protein
MKILGLSLLVAIFFPILGFAGVPTNTEAGPLLKGARVKGYSFDVDMAFGYQPKFVQEAKVYIVFALENIKKNGQPISVIENRNDPEFGQKLNDQFNRLCRDIFDIKAAQIPEAEVSGIHYEYFESKLDKLGCSVDLPAK